jgi:cysteine synthase B
VIEASTGNTGIALAMIGRALGYNATIVMPENVRTHYETTGAEILEDLPDVDVLVAGLGTGGTIMGTGMRLKEARPHVKLVGVEPHPGSQVQGLKSLDDGYIPPILDPHLLDGKILIRSPHAFEHAVNIINREGVFPGLSSGAVLHGAMRFANRMERGNIVCIFADSGWKYYGTDIWDAAHAGEPHDEDAEDIIWW